MSPICTGRSPGAVLPTRGVVGTEDTGVVGDSGRSFEMLFDRSILKRLVPAQPNDVSSGGGGVSVLSRSDMGFKFVSNVATDGDRGRFAPNNPRSAETATEGGRVSWGDEARSEGEGEDVPATEAA